MTKPESVRQKISHFTILSRLVIGHFLLYKPITVTIKKVFGAFNNNYLYAGKSNTTKATLSYLLYRDSKRKTSISGSFWSRQSQNYIDGAEIEVQNVVWQDGKQAFLIKNISVMQPLSYRANYKRGTGARGSIEAPEELWGEGTSRPKIMTASIELTKPLC